MVAKKEGLGKKRTERLGLADVKSNFINNHNREPRDTV